MYTIALIQNQSEMSHYGYADARPLLASTTYAGYKVMLYTGQNIANLAYDISTNSIDALIIASHALNDKAINSAFNQPEFKDSLKNFLDAGFGCLILHQLRLGERARDNDKKDGQLSFLPDDFSDVFAMARPRTDEGIESSIIGEISFANSSEDHFLLHYPNDLSSAKIQSKCLQEGGLQGLYWHYWDGIDPSKWDILIKDDQADKEKSRILMISSKESFKYRIVLSSLTLDWQHQNEVLENLIKYVVEGHQYIALLTTNQRPTIGLSYLMERLKSKHFSYKHYIIPQNTDIMLNSIKRRFHSIIVATKDCYSTLDRETKEQIDTAVRDGTLKLLEIGEADFTVYGRERDTLKLLNDIELRVQFELGNGFIDYSFWSTVESLQVLMRLPERTLPLDKELLQKVIDDVNIHDMDGSYDGVFGASCALLWFRSTFLGASNPQTKRTAEWIRSRIEQYESREQVLALLNMLQSGFSSLNNTIDEDTNALKRIIDQIDYSNQSEINAIMYLQAANWIGNKGVAKELSKCLCDSTNQKEGIWVDISTTATAIVALLSARTLLAGDNNIIDKIDNSLFAAVIAIQKSRTRDASARAYLWDSKASTNLKCLEALLNFERTIELPVTELMDSLETYTHSSIDMRTLETSLNVLLETQLSLVNMQQENSTLMHIISKLKTDTKKYRRAKKAIWIGSVVLSFLLYTTILFITYFSSQTELGIDAYFSSQLPLHFTFIGVVVAVIFGLLAITRAKKEE